MIFFPSLCLSLAETKAGKKPGLGGGKVLNIIVRNFSFQCIKFKVCQASTESPERILSSGPAYGIVIGVQRWKNVIQGSSYGKLLQNIASKDLGA